MAIRFVPKVGQVLLCDFGQFPSTAQTYGDPPDFNRRIPPEMVKRRLVIVLNGRLSRQSCIVVPISASFDPSKMSVGVNVELPVDAICPLIHFMPCVRWAKADCVQTVSNRRLTLLKDAKGAVDCFLHPELVERVQRAAVRALNAGALLIPLNEQALLISAGPPPEGVS